MSLYRCAACGSPNVVKHEEKDGFSYKKAIAGTVVFGAIGAVAGIDGKTKEVYSCPDCGATLSEPMDSITQAKIDSVMIAPETLVPMVFPDMYDRFAYLRNEIDQRRTKAKEETFARLTAVSNVQQNPLNVSEAEFRQSAKEVNDALELLDCYLRYYEEHGMPNFESGEMIGVDEWHKFIPNTKDIESICQSLVKMKNVVYALSYYRNLIHYDSNVENGLGHYNLSKLLFTYVMMERGECTCREFYYYANSNQMLKQAFMLIMNKTRYDRKIRDQIKYFGEPSEDKMMQYWFECITEPWCPTIDYKQYNDNDFSMLCGFYVRDTNKESYNNRMRCRIRLFDNTLHFINLEDPEKLFEKASPKLALQIKSKKRAIEQTQKRYEELTTDQPSTEEQNKAQQIKTIDQQIAANQTRIQELQKVKLFGKKKAQAKAEELTNENGRLKSQITALKKEIEALKAARIQENKKASEEMCKQLDNLKKELAELQIPMNDFMRSVRWLPVK